MNDMNVDIRVNKELVGNLMVLIANKCKPLYFTKLLKILYLIDEEYTKKFGYPLTWLKYEAWELGPVPRDVFYSKNKGLNRYSKYITFQDVGENKKIVKAATEFDDMEFSDADLSLVNDVINKYQHNNVNELINIVHKEGSLWKKTKDKFGLKFSPDNKTSDVQLDFSDLLDDEMKQHYFDGLEFLQLKASLLD